MTRQWLRPDVRMAVEYRDQTFFGSPVSGRGELAVRELYAPLVDHVLQHSYGRLIEEAPALLRGVVASESFSRIAEPDHAGAWRFHPAVLYPDIALAKPSGFSCVREATGRQLQATLPPEYWPHMHSLMAGLRGPGADDDDPGLHPDLRAMLLAMVREELVEAEDSSKPAPLPELQQPGLTFVGHNTVVVRSQSTAVIVDPFLSAAGSAYPAGYQPLQVRDLGRIDAILITHSHPDHFDPATLLQFPPETRVIVPAVERETMLATAMDRRLAELGFTRISIMEWWQSTLVGDVEVHALPFYGEQPTDGETLHPAIRNAGNTYLVRTPDFSAAFLADSGRDGQGDVRAMASRARARHGPVDVVFSGYRGWLTYPAQLLFSSVGRFLLFVPPWLWNVRQQIMATADEAVDIAERWGARFLVPYADGGAPWHWRMGLGPRLDEAPAEQSAFDPFPERLVAAMLARSEAPDGTRIASPVQPLLLRPGDGLVELAGTPRRIRIPGHVWPYEETAVGAPVALEAR